MTSTTVSAETIKLPLYMYCTTCSTPAGVRSGRWNVVLPCRDSFMLELTSALM